jgi:hypothetical protein
LVYRVLDEQGNKVGVPISASDFFSKPTLKNIREKFAVNEEARAPYRTRVRNAVDMVLLQGGLDLNGLQSDLKKEGIDLVIRQNSEGVIYGLTYVDHLKKTVFNGSDLGKAYSARAILERCANGVAGEGKRNIGEAEKMGADRVVDNGCKSVKNEHFFAGEGKNNGGPGLVETILDAGEQAPAMDWQLKRKRKKKKRRRVTLS